MDDRSTESLHISYRDMTASPALDATIRRKAAKLNRVCDRIIDCRVIVEYPHVHAHKARHYVVRLHLVVPGVDIEAGRDHTLDSSHENPYVAVRDAFRAARRQLERYAKRRRSERHDGGDDERWVAA